MLYHLVEVPADNNYSDHPEDGKRRLAKIARQVDPERHARIFNKAEQEPVPDHMDGLAHGHMGLYPYLEDLIRDKNAKDDQQRKGAF